MAFGFYGKATSAYLNPDPDPHPSPSPNPNPHTMQGGQCLPRGHRLPSPPPPPLPPRPPYVGPRRI
eukprot:scaffold75169_cov27-Phaeocystis_antarctica.AAC.1